MGHAISILTFDSKETKESIRRKCDVWADGNMDHEESSSHTLPYPVQFTSRVFNSLREAEAYLETTFGNYREIAVQYKQPKGKEQKPTQKLLAVKKKIDDLTKRLRAMDAPHYQGVKSKTIGCKNCGSALATAYCGKTFGNNCPVCKAELRPASALAGKANVEQQLRAAKAELAQLERAMHDKQLKSGYELCWAVACEVHC